MSKCFTAVLFGTDGNSYTVSARSHMFVCVCVYMWSYNKVCELIAVKLLHTSLLNTTVVAFKVLHLGSYASIPAPSPPFTTILELFFFGMAYRTAVVVLLMSSMSSKCLPFNISFIFGNRKKVTGG